MPAPDTSRFGRRGAGRPLRRWLIVSEDEKSSLIYLRRFVPANCRDVRIVTSGGHGDGLRVVQEAIRCKQAAAARGERYIRVWCVFDKDDMPAERFDEAFKLAASHQDIEAIWANEAFELWYLLHFQLVETAQPRRSICEKLERCLGRRYDKADESLYDDLGKEELLKSAFRNAERLARNRSGINPSLNVHALVRELIKIRDEAMGDSRGT